MNLKKTKKKGKKTEKNGSQKGKNKKLENFGIGKIEDWIDISARFTEHGGCAAFLPAPLWHIRRPQPPTCLFGDLQQRWFLFPLLISERARKKMGFFGFLEF